MNELRVIIAGGGTGGHIFPAVAIGHALRRLQPDVRLLFVGARGKMEMEKVPQEGFEIKGLDIAGFNRSNLLKNLTLPYKLLKSRFESRNILNTFKPNVVVGVGGYASFPILSAAQAMGIPTLIQEQNSYAGKSNKILGRRAKAICVAYDNMKKFFPADKLMHTGNPVRRSIAQMNHSAAEGRTSFDLRKDIETILVVGGSLGARSVNEAINHNLENILSDDVQLIWQTGKQYYEQAAKCAQKYSGRIKVVDFIKEMELAYAAATVVISRAGALAIAELCIAGKPVVFVPYPHAAENHQTENAMMLVNRNCALMVSDNLVSTELVKELKLLLADPEKRAVMAENLQAMAIKDADERIAHKVIAIAKGQ